jgi:hypothetical protein
VKPGKWNDPEKACRWEGNRAKKGACHRDNYQYFPPE